MKLNQKCIYIGDFVGKLESCTISYDKDIEILYSHKIINKSLNDKLLILYKHWTTNLFVMEDSNEFSLMINLMYKAIKDYEAK